MIEQNIFTIIFAIFTLFTVRDVFFGQADHHGVDHSKAPTTSENLNHHHHHNVEPGGQSHIGLIPDHHGHMGGPPLHMLKIQYCHSCGYRQAFEEIRSRLKTDIPMLLVEGETNRPGFLRSQIANLVFLAKIAFFVMIYARFDPFAYFHLETPRFWQFVSQNRLSASVMVLLLASSIESNMMSTGAFEISYNGLEIWSKIQTGRLPSYPELIETIRSQMMINMGGKNKYPRY